MVTEPLEISIELAVGSKVVFNSCWFDQGL